MADIDGAIQKIANNVKPDQVHYGPTVLIVDLGRLGMPPQGKFGLAPVFLQKRPVEACVSGELWHVGFGEIGDRIFVSPEFEGKTNLGVIRGRPGLCGSFLASLESRFSSRRGEQAELGCSRSGLWNSTKTGF